MDLWLYHSHANFSLWPNKISESEQNEMKNSQRFDGTVNSHDNGVEVTKEVECNWNNKNQIANKKQCFDDINFHEMNSHSTLVLLTLHASEYGRVMFNTIPEVACYSIENRINWRKCNFMSHDSRNNTELFGRILWWWKHISDTVLLCVRYAWMVQSLI